LGFTYLLVSEDASLTGSLGIKFPALPALSKQVNQCSALGIERFKRKPQLLLAAFGAGNGIGIVDKHIADGSRAAVGVSNLNPVLL
jgi:hypothetical protein